MEGSTPFFRAGGTIHPDAPSYIVRAADHELLRALTAGEYAFLLDSRQKGKSSLVGRTILKLREAGFTCIKIDLQRIGANVTPEQWYAGLLASLGQELDLESELYSYWEAHRAMGPLARLLGALECVVLSNTVQPLAVFIDEIDFVRSLPFATDEFFAGIRDCYNRRSEARGFERLTFCLVGVATPGQLIRNAEITPFNIGTRVDLSDFTPEETAAYAQVLTHCRRNGGRVLSRVHHWVSGHPYLTQLLCSVIASAEHIDSEAAVDRLVHDLFLSPDGGRRDAHLADVERRAIDADLPGVDPAEASSRVLDAYRRVLSPRGLLVDKDDPVVGTLRISGLTAESGGFLHVRNRLYRKVFDEAWRRRHLPDHEVRRQRTAARGAALKTAAIGAVIVLATGTSAFGMWRLSSDRAKSLSDLRVRTGELNRVAQERERSLMELSRRTTELTKVSADRQRSLADLQAQKRKVERISEEQGRSLEALRQRTAQLNETNHARLLALAEASRREKELWEHAYDQQMALVRMEYGSSRWTMISRLVDAVRDNPNRGWEWGYLALLTNLDRAEVQLPKWSRLERQPNGELWAVTREGIYDLSTATPRRIGPLSDDYCIPRFRVGKYRVMVRESMRSDIICDSSTGKVVVPPRRYSMVKDIDPRRGLYLMTEDETLDTVQVRTIEGDRLVLAYKTPEDTSAARFLPDGTVLSVHQRHTPDSGLVRHWNLAGETLDSAPTDQVEASYDGLSVSSGGTYYAVWGHNGKVDIRRVQNHEKVSSMPISSARTTDLVFSDDETIVLAGYADGVLRTADVRDGRLLRFMVGHKNGAYSVAFGGPNTGVVSIDDRGLLRRWGSKGSPNVQTYINHKTEVMDAYLAADGETLISAGTDGKVASRSIARGASDRPRIGRSTISVMARNEGGQWAFVGTRDGGIERIEPASLKVQRSARVFDGNVEGLFVMDSQRRLLARGPRGQLAVLDATDLHVISRIEPRRVRAPADPAGVELVDALAVDSEGPRFAIFYAMQGDIQVFSALDGARLSRWVPGQAVLSMSFVEKGQELVASLGSAFWMRDARMAVYKVSTGRLVHDLGERGSAGIWMAYSPKAHVLAVRQADGANLWDTRTMHKIAELDAESGVGFFDFSPDGDRLILNTWGGIRIWNSRTGAEYAYLRTGPPSQPGQSRYPKPAHFSADGRNIVLPLTDGSVRVFRSLPWK